jgi:hypothetical protein
LVSLALGELFDGLDDGVWDVSSAEFTIVQHAGDANQDLFVQDGVVQQAQQLSDEVMVVLLRLFYEVVGVLVEQVQQVGGLWCWRQQSVEILY